MVIQGKDKKLNRVEVRLVSEKIKDKIPIFNKEEHKGFRDREEYKDKEEQYLNNILNKLLEQGN